MKRLVLIVAATIALNVGYSQGDFRKGFIITHDKDTVYGLVAFREGTRAYHECVFKRSADQQSTTYAPLDISGYGFINDKVFESRDVALRGQAPTTAFLEVLVKGLVTLYRVDDAYLVQEEDGELQQLIDELYRDVVKGRTVLRHSNEHIKVLNPLLFDCVETRELVQKAKMTQRSLTKLIERYNECVDAPAVTPKEAKPWFKVRPAIAGGVLLSNLEFDEHPYYDHLSGTFERATMPFFGLSGDFLSPRISERFSVNIAAFFSAAKYNGYTNIYYLGATIEHWVDIDLPQIKVPMGFRYTFPAGGVMPYINAGISSSFHLDRKSHWLERWEYNGTVTIDEKDEALKIKASQTGWWGGVGIQKPIGDKFVLFGEVRYERTDGIAESFLQAEPRFGSTISNVRFVIGVNLK
jgi:hypothetical protein